MERARVYAVGEVIGAAPRKPRRDVRYDGLCLPRHERGLPIAEALEPCAEAVTEAAGSENPEPNGALRPEVRHVEDHRRPRAPAEPQPGEPQKQGRAFHEEILAAAQQQAAGGRRGAEEREVVRQPAQQIRPLRREDEGADDAHAVPALPSPETPVTP